MTHNDTHRASMNLFLASKFASEKINGSESHVVFNIRNPIIPDPTTRILMCVTDLEIPYSFYIFRTTNNTLRIVQGGVNVDFTLPVGNYNVTTLTAAFNIAGGTLAVAGITASYDATNNKLSFISAASTLVLDTTVTTMLFEIGFKESQGSDTPSATITGINMTNLSGLPNLYLRAKNISVENYDSNNAVAGTLCKIPVSVLPLEYIFYRPVENLYVLIADKQITSMDLAIEDEEGNLVSLNGGQWSATFSIHFQKNRIAPGYQEGSLNADIKEKIEKSTPLTPVAEEEDEDKKESEPN